MLSAIILGAAALLAAAPAPRPRAPLTVVAAISLTEALSAIGQAYTARTGVPVRFSFASSAAAARQITGGARADVFFSADQEWMDFAANRGAIDRATRVTVATGRLALIEPSGRRTAVRIERGLPVATLLGRDGRLAMGDPAYVPAGRYARAALISLGVWKAIEPRLARADNVRLALSYVARREAPLGIVYESDARAEPLVRIVGLFPAASHPPIIYPAAIVRGAGPEARRFLAFVRSPAGLAIFARHGFGAAR